MNNCTKRGFERMLKRVVLVILLTSLFSCIASKEEIRNPFRITGKELTEQLKVKQFVPVTFIDDFTGFNDDSMYLVEEVIGTLIDIGVSFPRNERSKEIINFAMKGEANCDDIFSILYLMNKLEKKMDSVSHSVKKRKKNCNTFFVIDEKKIPVYIWMKREVDDKRKIDDFYIWYIVEEDLLFKKKSDGL